MKSISTILTRGFRLRKRKRRNPMPRSVDMKRSQGWCTTFSGKLQKRPTQMMSSQARAIHVDTTTKVNNRPSKLYTLLICRNISHISVYPTTFESNPPFEHQQNILHSHQGKREHYSTMGGSEFSIEYAYKTRPSSLLNNLFMSTVNTAANSLVSVASNVNSEPEKWRPRDHFRFMVMLMSWTTVWVMRVLMDHLPVPMVSFNPNLLLGGFSPVKALPPPTSSSSSSLTLELIEEDLDAPTVRGLSRALTHVLALMNDIPATSRKYQFAMSMADKIMDGNFRDGHEELMNVNRTSLSSAFARTLALLNLSLKYSTQSLDETATITSRVINGAIKALPMGSYLVTYAKGLNYCLKTVLHTVKHGVAGLEQRLLVAVGGNGVGGQRDDVMSEKLAQELLWITSKLRTYGAIDEAVVHWSFAKQLAALSLTVPNPRVQGLILKLSAMLFVDLPKDEIDVSSNVKFRMLGVWIPLFCHANSGQTYPVLTSFEKFEVERAMNQVISTLPTMEQEVILTNWLQDFSVTTSDWPNLQDSYDRWCQSTRQLVS